MEKSTVWKLAGTAAGLGALGGIAALGNLLYNTAIAPNPRTEPSPANRWPAIQEGRAWIQTQAEVRSVTLTSADGLSLWAAHVPACTDTPRWAICMHGYRDTHADMGAIAKHYHELGWNVLMPDERGHGLSGGNYVGWGYDERLDVLIWIRYITRRDPNAVIVLHGVSMGSAAILLASGGPLPGAVKAIISDCAYTDIESEMKHVLDHRVRKALSIPITLPFSVIFSALRRITLHRAGYDLRDVTPLRAVEHSVTPTLFVHGTEDAVVPPEMLDRLYQAAGCPKAVLRIAGANHTESCGADPDRYWAAAEQFLSRFCP